MLFTAATLCIQIVIHFLPVLKKFFLNQLRLVKQGILPTHQVEQDNQVKQAHSGPPIQACRQGGQDYRIKLEIPESGSSLCGKFVIVVVVAYHNFPSGH